jgi:CheY-like chemotaxis protein
MNTQLTRFTILIIDDDNNLRQVLYRILLLAGYNVIECNNPTDGISLAITYQPHLILMDYIMPGFMCGIDAANILRRNQQTSNIPIIIISANRLDTTQYVCLLKPLDQTELHTAICNHLFIASNTSMDGKSKC